MSPVKLLLLGAPGAGKGTQAQRLMGSLGVPQISTGDILREARRQGTELGREAEAFMRAGQLVPDALVTAIVRERLAAPDCERGFILDGFPRNVAQAQALETMGVSLDVVIEIAVPDEDLMERLTGRLSCPSCKATFHRSFQPPKSPGVCDACGGALVTRSDDEPAVVRDRLRVYAEQTAPLVAFYREKGLLRTVDGGVAPERVYESVLELLPSGAE